MQDTGTISLYRRVLRGDGDSGKRSWMGRLAGRWEWEFWIRHGRTGGSGWALAGGGLGVRASSQERDVWRGGGGRTSGRVAGAGRRNSAWRPEQGAGGLGAEGLSGRESSYSGRAASVSSKYL